MVLLSFICTYIMLFCRASNRVAILNYGLTLRAIPLDFGILGVLQQRQNLRTVVRYGDRMFEVRCEFTICGDDRPAVGQRPGVEVRWQANRHLWFQADYGIFYAGTFVRESQTGRNLIYWALWTGYKF